MSLVLPAPAKLNLFLYIVGVREDGYRSLQTIFQFLDYCDQLDFSEDDELVLSSNVPDLMTDDNLILRAAQLLQLHTGCKKGAKISLNKILPIGGGVGGGSSNAATTLHGLNLLWDLGLSEDELAGLALQLGADVPVFVRGRAAFAEGVGEILTPIQPTEYWYLILKPDCQVDTTEMYCHPQLKRVSHPISVSTALKWLHGENLRNDFEFVVRKTHPEINECLVLMNDIENRSTVGPAMMSGSGSCVFIPFTCRELAEAMLHRVCSKFDGFVARGVNRSPLHRYLNELLS